MGKTYGGQPFNLGFDIQATKPIDNRQVVDTISDIFVPSTWKNEDGNYYAYPGMFTIAKDSGILASYKGEANNPAAIAVPENWTVYEPYNNGVVLGITQDAYDLIEQKQPTMYYIVNSNGELRRVYFGTTLFARKAVQGDVLNMAFPLTFPLIFA